MVSWQEFLYFWIILKTGSGKDILVSVVVPWDVNCWPFAQQRAGEGHLGTQQGLKTPQTFSCLGCEGIKAQGFLCSEFLPGGTSSSFYFFIAPRWNYFKDWDIWDSVMGALRWSLSHCECGMCSCEGALVPPQEMGVCLPVAPAGSDREVSSALKLRPFELCFGRLLTSVNGWSVSSSEV